MAFFASNFLRRGVCARPQATLLSHRRHLSLHEYQSMDLMNSFGIPVPKCAAVRTPQEAANVLSSMQFPVIVKAQVLAGGRGLGYFKETNFQGGVHKCKNPLEVEQMCMQMLGKTLVTKQTGDEGRPCACVLVSECFDVKKEMYLALTLDRACGGTVLIGSARGGTSIEDIAEKFPESIIRMPIDISKGVSESNLDEFQRGMGLGPEQTQRFSSLVRGLFEMFVKKDCLMVEVNPLVETVEGNLEVCDAKLNFDDNAAFRQKDLFSSRDKSQENIGEVLAEKFNLNYIKLKGSIGCMVNGAGLAMATMDLIQSKGAAPANFLDVGGGAEKDQIVQALNIIQTDRDAKAILVNIFGGIMRCDIIAKGLLAAVQEIGLKKPLVVRLEGTNKEEAAELMRVGLQAPECAGLQVHMLNDFDKAAELVVKLANE